MSVGAFNSIQRSVNFPSLVVVKSFGQVCRFIPHGEIWLALVWEADLKSAHPEGKLNLPLTSGTAALAPPQTPVNCILQGGSSQVLDASTLNMWSFFFKWTVHPIPSIYLLWIVALQSVSLIMVLRCLLPSLKLFKLHLGKLFSRNWTD